MTPRGHEPQEPVSPCAGGAPPADRRVTAVCLALFIGTLLLFSRAVPHDFLDCDDPDYVTKNVHVQNGLTGSGVRWAFTANAAGNWHPLTWLSHMLDWQLFGNDARGPHAVNVLWHAANAVLAFLALRRLTGALWPSALSAALFAWHPLRVESVAWIAERKDVLSVFFALLALWTYAIYADERRKSSDKRSKRFYALALAAFAAGLLCKPMLVSLPFILLLLDYWPLRRWTARDGRFTAGPLIVEKIPFVTLSAVSCIVTYLAQEKAGAVVETIPFIDRLQNAVVSVAGYLANFFWPFNLALGYPRPAHQPAFAVAGATLLLLTLTGLAFWQRRRRPWLIVGWLWFLAALIPVIGLVPVGMQAMADRYTYLPILGWQLALVWMCCDAGWTPMAQRFAVTAVSMVLLICALRTWTQLAVWRNSHALYEHALAVTKNNYLANCYLGTTLFNEGRLEESRLHFQGAIALKPDYSTARLRLGLVLERLGRDDEALATYQELLRLKPDFCEAQFRCANLLARMNRDEEALRHYARAIQLQPDFEEAQRNDADSLRALNRLKEACERYQAALALRPDDAYAHYGLGAALEDSGRPDEALTSYRRAIELNPQFADAHYDLGVLLFNRQQTAEAIGHFQAAIRSRTNYAAAYLALGIARGQLSQTREAILDLEQAQRLNPNLPGVTNALAELRQKFAAERTVDRP
jgi:tetratricopeptide (TPR) repeat protein